MCRLLFFPITQPDLVPSLFHQCELSRLHDFLEGCPHTFCLHPFRAVRCAPGIELGVQRGGSGVTGRRRLLKMRRRPVATRRGAARPNEPPQCDECQISEVIPAAVDHRSAVVASSLGMGVRQAQGPLGAPNNHCSCIIVFTLNLSVQKRLDAAFISWKGPQRRVLLPNDPCLKSPSMARQRKQGNLTALVDRLYASALCIQLYDAGHVEWRSLYVVAFTFGQRLHLPLTEVLHLLQPPLESLIAGAIAFLVAGGRGACQDLTLGGRQRAIRAASCQGVPQFVGLSRDTRRAGRPPSTTHHRSVASCLVTVGAGRLVARS
jgi:hypothetical protein